MYFTLTMNMPTRNAQVHQVFIEHQAKTLPEFLKILATSDFVMAEEFHLFKNERNQTELQARGPILINQMCIGKVKVFEER